MSNVKEQMLSSWTKKAKEVLEGRTIKEVRYLTDEEMEEMMWTSRAICFFLDNGEYCIISSDDEGNDGGSILYGKENVLPTL